VAFACATVLAAAATGGVMIWRAQEAALGARIFSGVTPLGGRIVGHEEDLPPQASRCANCHLMSAAAESSADLTKSTQRFGPALSAALLKEAISRRHGPPSRYDKASFCMLLRTGVDPVQVVVPRAMPRYAVNAKQCAALWAYLTAQ
jgi:hypothetical protein